MEIKYNIKEKINNFDDLTDDKKLEIIFMARNDFERFMKEMSKNYDLPKNLAAQIINTCNKWQINA